MTPFEPEVCHDNDNGEDHSEDDHIDRQASKENASCDRGHECRLRRRKRIRMIGGGYADPVSSEKQGQGGSHHQGGRDNSDDVHQLLLIWRRANNSSRLQILEVVAGNRCR